MIKWQIVKYVTSDCIGEIIKANQINMAAGKIVMSSAKKLNEKKIWLNKFLENEWLIKRNMVQRWLYN